nr:MAG TPA: hypothetical protein [Bacteriophage sp.]DAT53393.1 MAG TPA: hypothetical protein [Caudoviricetes sp.]
MMHDKNGMMQLSDGMINPKFSRVEISIQFCVK